MYAVGLSEVSYSFFAAASLTITIPSGIQMFAWIGTMLSGRVVMNPAMLYAVGFIIAFVIGGVTGVMFGVVSFDQQVTDSYFVVAHFHYVLFGGAILPMLAGLYYWWPKLTGRMPSNRAGYISFATVFLGFNVTFFPMHIVGLLGMPRRIYTYRSGLGWDTYNLISTIGSYILAAGLLWTLVSFIYSLFRGPLAPDDPWEGNTLEWATGSPPKPYNFPVIPTVYSLNPLWDGQTLASMERLKDTDERTLAEEEMTLQTSELDGRIEQPITMPSETPVPFLTAVWLLLAVLAMLYSSYWMVGVAGVLFTITVMWWLWFRPDVE
jgi:cytochrome c oxidase subunit 1/cytochrome c oxidase subunit I+III